MSNRFEDILLFNYVIGFHFYLNETAGTSAAIFSNTDVSLTAGTYHGTVGYNHTSVLIDSAEPSIGFNGSTTYADAVTGSYTTWQSSFCLYAIFRGNSLTGDQMLVDNDKVALYLNAGVITLQWTSGATVRTLSSGVTISTGRRYVVFVVQDSTGFLIYVDGVLKASLHNSTTVTIDSGAGAPNIGRRRSGNDWFFNGDIGKAGFIEQWLDIEFIVELSQAARSVGFSAADELEFREGNTSGGARPFSVEDSLFIDFDWTEQVALHLPINIGVNDTLNLVDTAYAGHPRPITITQVLTLTDSAYLAGNRSYLLKQTIVLTESQGRIGPNYITEAETISLNEAVGVAGAREFYIKEIIFLNQSATFSGVPVVKTFTVINTPIVWTEVVAIEWGIANITRTDTINLVEKVGLRLSIWSPILTDTLVFTQVVKRIKDFSVTDTIVFTQSALRTFPITRTDTLTFIEALTTLKVRPTKDTITFIEDVCTKNIFNRTISETIALSDRVLGYATDPAHPFNNPTFIGWIDITEAEWNQLTQDQWNNLLYTTPTDNTGFVILPNKRTIKIREHITFVERLTRIGGHAHCDSTGINLLSVHFIDSFHISLTFSASVTTTSGPTPDDNFDLEGSPPTDLTTQTGTTITLHFGDGDAIGGNWTLTAQPNWLVTPVNFPTSGLVLA